MSFPKIYNLVPRTTKGKEEREPGNEVEKVILFGLRHAAKKSLHLSLDKECYDVELCLWGGLKTVNLITMILMTI